MMFSSSVNPKPRHRIQLHSGRLSQSQQVDERVFKNMYHIKQVIRDRGCDLSVLLLLSLSFLLRAQICPDVMASKYTYSRSWEDDCSIRLASRPRSCGEKKTWVGLKCHSQTGGRQTWAPWHRGSPNTSVGNQRKASSRLQLSSSEVERFLVSGRVTASNSARTASHSISAGVERDRGAASDFY